jgi:hypothetical protein
MSEADSDATRAAALFVHHFHTSDVVPLRPVPQRERNAIRGVTLLDAEWTELSSSMDDYRDVERFMAQEALAWLREHEPSPPAAARVRATRAALSLLWANDRRRRLRQTHAAVLRATVLEAWPEAEIGRVSRLLFEVGLLRWRQEPDGPLWYSSHRDGIRFHEPTARRLFPDLEREDPAAAAVRAALPRAAR